MLKRILRFFTKKENSKYECIHTPELRFDLYRCKKCGKYFFNH